MLGFKDFHCAHVILSGIKVMHMIKSGQVEFSGKFCCPPHSSYTP